MNYSFEISDIVDTIVGDGYIDYTYSITETSTDYSDYWQIAVPVPSILKEITVECSDNIVSPFCGWSNTDIILYEFSAGHMVSLSTNIELGKEISSTRILCGWSNSKSNNIIATRITIRVLTI